MNSVLWQPSPRSLRLWASTHLTLKLYFVFAFPAPTFTPGKFSCHIVYLLCFFSQVPPFSTTTMFPELFVSWSLFFFLIPIFCFLLPNLPILNSKLPKRFLNSSESKQTYPQTHSWVHTFATCMGTHTQHKQTCTRTPMFTDFHTREQTPLASMTRRWFVWAICSFISENKHTWQYWGAAKSISLFTEQHNWVD